ncbi:5-methylcytosine-specific restriction enzyme subunit McrC [Lysinibacillus sphaericus]|nr:5-methylcytosine-specific restriction enzyme subunit McrC [Lysinibacillus sphaericus]
MIAMRKKLYELKEYDVLTTNAVAGKQNGYVHIDKYSFKLLEQLILTFNENEEENDAIEFLTLSSKRNVGKVIRTKNYVGLLQLSNGVQLQILPKIHGGSDNDTRKIFLNMLKALKDFPSKTFNESHLAKSNMPIFEVFIRQYIREVQMIVKRGLKSTYYDEQENLRVYKGKMNFSQQIKNNLVHKERFYMQYDEFGVNRAENRLIKTTLMFLTNISSSTENIKELRKLLLYFEKVDTSFEIEKDFARAQYDRSMQHYQVGLNWSKIFLKKQSFSIFTGDNSAQALLFPMDRVFEDYIGQTIRKLLANTDLKVSLQDRGYYLFDRQFALRPDIILRNSEGRVIVVDTKWKLLKNNSRQNYGISQADMYQMYAYAKKYGTNEIVMVYPWSDEFEQNALIEFISADGVKVRILLVDCYHCELTLPMIWK